MPDIEWSSLPSDVLCIISSRLPSDLDHIRFRSVCTSWRSASPRRPYLLPWLIGQHNDTIFSFHKLSSNGDQIIPIPELTESDPFNGMPCRGSSHGWMALLDLSDPSILLYNPLTKSCIHLPTLPLFSKFNDCKNTYFKGRDGGYYWPNKMRTGVETTCRLSYHDTLYYLVNQVILSADPATSPDYIALAVCGQGRRLVFCRGGDDSWTLINKREMVGRYTRAVFHKGQFYISTSSGVYVCITEQNPRVKKLVSTRKMYYFGMFDPYLVESGRDLLLVTKFDTFAEYPRPMFEVFKIEKGSSSVFKHDKFKLVRLNSMGGRALFLGRNHSFSLEASQVAGCRGDSIYCTCSSYSDIFLSEHIMVHNFVDRRTELIIPKDDGHLPHPGWKACVWFTPSLLQ